MGPQSCSVCNGVDDHCSGILPLRPGTGIEGCAPTINLCLFWYGGHWLFTLDHDHHPAHLNHMKLGIVTDSTSDLPKYLIEQYELEVVPSILILDGKEYADGIGISREEFYKRLPSLPHSSSATTAAPSIGDFSARYDSLLTRGCEHILSIHATGALTTIINSARQAAQGFPEKITVIDSLSLSLGLGFQVLAAAEVAAESAETGLQAALDAVQATRKRLHLFAALDTMENMRRSGRVPAAVTFLGGLLNIKPLIEITNGEVKAVGAVR